MYGKSITYGPWLGALQFFFVADRFCKFKQSSNSLSINLWSLSDHRQTNLIFVGCRLTFWYLNVSKVSTFRHRLTTENQPMVDWLFGAILSIGWWTTDRTRITFSIYRYPTINGDHADDAVLKAFMSKTLSNAQCGYKWITINYVIGRPFKSNCSWTFDDRAKIHRQINSQTPEHVDVSINCCDCSASSDTSVRRLCLSSRRKEENVFTRPWA